MGRREQGRRGLHEPRRPHADRLRRPARRRRRTPLTGRPAAGPSSLDVIGTDDAGGERRFNDGSADQVYRVRPGSYFPSAFVATPDAGPGPTLLDSLTYLGRPQVEVKKDTVVLLDARTAGRLSVETDKPSEARSITLPLARSWEDVWLHAGTAMGGRTAGRRASRCPCGSN